MVDKVDGLFFQKVVEVTTEKTYVMKLNEEEIIKDYGSVDEFKRLFSEDEFDYDKIKKSKYHLNSTSISGEDIVEEFVDERIGDFTYYSNKEFVTQPNVLDTTYKLYFELNNE